MKFKYSSGIAPLVTAKEYADLKNEYKKSGQFPHILKLGGMAIDTTQNRNKWRVPLADLNDVAAQLKGAPLMKDHDIDHVDSIIGKVEEAWVEEDGQGGGKVIWKGECSDESLIQKILLGYVKNNSIQIAVPQAYCDNCITHLGKSEEEASLDNLDFPCPRCGSLEMVARHPAVLEQSLVAIPAYEKADVTPFGFRAALDNFQEKRIENARKAGWKEGNPKPYSSAPDLTPMVIAAFNAVTQVEMAVLETQARLLQGELEEALPGQTGRKAKPGLEHIIERMGGPEEWTPEDVIEPEKVEADTMTCSQCGQPVNRFDVECSNCGYPNKSPRTEEADKPRCAVCGSTNIDTKGGVYLCMECDNMWEPGTESEGLRKFPEETGGSVADFPLAER